MPVQDPLRVSVVTSAYRDWINSQEGGRDRYSVTLNARATALTFDEIARPLAHVAIRGGGVLNIDVEVTKILVR